MESVEKKVQSFLRGIRKEKPWDHYVIIDSPKGQGKLIISYSPESSLEETFMYFNWFLPTWMAGHPASESICPPYGNKNDPYHGLREIGETVVRSLKRKSVKVHHLNKINPELVRWAYIESVLVRREIDRFLELRSRHPEYFYPGIGRSILTFEGE